MIRVKSRFKFFLSAIAVALGVLSCLSLWIQGGSTVAWAQGGVAPLDDWDVSRDFEKGGELETGSSEDVSPEDVGEEALRSRKASENSEGAGVDASTEDELSSEEPPDVEAPPPEKKSLKRLEKRRIEFARKKQTKIIHEQWENYKKVWHRDPRGEPELRICTLNFNNYGTFVAFKKISRGRKDRYLKVERSLLRAISEVGCDLVAGQGMAGLDRAGTTMALLRFSDRLAERTGRSWRFYISRSNLKWTSNVFLIGNRNFKVLGTNSYTKVALREFEGSRLKVFPRGPFELILLVPGKSGAPRKTILAVTYFLYSKRVVKKNEDAPRVLQMSESLRRILEKRVKGMEGSPDVIPVLLGDRASGRYSAAARVLSGTLTLSDFGEGEPCSIAPDGKADCEDEPERPKLLFGLLDEEGPKKPKIITRIIDGEPSHFVEKLTKSGVVARHRRQSERKSEIYLMQKDLKYARVRKNRLLHYRAGSVKVTNYLRGSPLVWVELNW